MKTFPQYLDMAKAKTGSDRQTAIRIGIEPSRIATARKKGQLGVEICTKIAEVAEVDPMEVIAAAEVLKHPEKKKFWSKWIAATVILSVGITAQHIDSSGVLVAAVFDHAIYYAQLEYVWGYMFVCALVLSFAGLFVKFRGKSIDWRYETIPYNFYSGLAGEPGRNGYHSRLEGLHGKNLIRRNG